VAVVLALACAILLKFLIDKKISKSLDTQKVSYVVANTDLQSGILVDPYDQKAFAVRSDIPAQFAQSNAITPDQAESIKGSLLIANMKRGDILTWQMINTDERSQLANKLLPGRRALTIPV
ncbi:SAF domain-containing protein, partial [Escherichia coli]|uniref:SAF domain-containing protein n=1 Tax=Escherichia coli TaxID=562 RepID=UPI00200EFDB1